MKPNLSLKNISKTFPHASSALWGKKSVVHVLRHISFDLAAGQGLGIVGESGSGKTTLAKIVAGFWSADSGEAMWGNTDLLSMARQDRSRLVQMVFQDPFSSLNPKLLLETQLKEAMKSDGSLLPLMEEVGLSARHLLAYPHQLSGGQRQRFAIARALAANPQLLIADEPVSSLDVSVQAQIINLLNQLRKTRGFGLILISHDLSVVANTCEHIIVLKNGEIVESGTTEQLLHHPSNDYTQRLLAAAPMI